MPFPLIPVLIAAGTALSGYLSSRQAKKQRDLAKSESELAFQRQKEMIDQQNLYNAPESQLDRYRAAGLNPTLIYGSGSASAGNQAQTASYEPSRQTSFVPALIPEMLSQFQDFSMKQAQIDNVKAQTENTHSKTMTEAIRQYVMKIQGETSEFDLSMSRHMKPYQAAILGNEARTSNLMLEKELQRLQLMSQEQQMNLLNQEYKKKAMTAVDIDNEKRQADLLYKQYQNQWMKAGVTSGDNIILRILVRMMSDSGFRGDIGELLPK